MNLNQFMHQNKILGGLGRPSETIHNRWIQISVESDFDQILRPSKI